MKHEEICKSIPWKKVLENIFLSKYLDIPLAANAMRSGNCSPCFKKLWLHPHLLKYYFVPTENETYRMEIIYKRVSSRTIPQPPFALYHSSI